VQRDLEREASAMGVATGLRGRGGLRGGFMRGGDADDADSAAHAAALEQLPPLPPPQPGKTHFYVSAISPLITCSLCKGFLCEATTLCECLHSFCEACIVPHVREHKRCPRCGTEVQLNNSAHKAYRGDRSLQSIVDKVQRARGLLAHGGEYGAGDDDDEDGSGMYENGMDEEWDDAEGDDSSSSSDSSSSGSSDDEDEDNGVEMGSEAVKSGGTVAPMDGVEHHRRGQLEPVAGGGGSRSRSDQPDTSPPAKKQRQLRRSSSGGGGSPSPTAGHARRVAERAARKALLQLSRREGGEMVCLHFKCRGGGGSSQHGPPPPPTPAAGMEEEAAAAGAAAAASPPEASAATATAQDDRLSASPGSPPTIQRQSASAGCVAPSPHMHDMLSQQLMCA
jgi:hypothetical protein